MFSNIHGLPEAKVLLNHLYISGVQYLMDLKLKKAEFEQKSSGWLFCLF